MSLDELQREIEELESEGAIVLLKWDGERERLRRTLVITRVETDYLFRRDTDDLAEALGAGIADYRAHHGRK